MDAEAGTSRASNIMAADRLPSGGTYMCGDRNAYMNITFMIKLCGRIYISPMKKQLPKNTVKQISREYIQIMKRAKDIGSRNRLLMAYSLGAVFIAMNRRSSLSTEENFSVFGVQAYNLHNQAV